MYFRVLSCGKKKNKTKCNSNLTNVYLITYKVKKKKSLIYRPLKCYENDRNILQKFTGHITRKTLYSYNFIKMFTYYLPT